MMNITPVVKQLLIINIIFFIGSNLILKSELASNYFALFYFENPAFKFWQPITHMFMHANLMHIFFNMFALYSFGSALEHFWGGKKFLFFYISCGLGAALLHSGINYFEIHSVLNSLSNLKFSQSEISVLLNADYKNLFDSNNQMIASNVKTILDRTNCTQEQFNTLMNAVGTFHSTAVGASGAVYGLLVAFAFMFPNAELAFMFIPVPIKAKYFVPGLLMIDLILGLRGSSLFGAGSTGIAHFAHIGGALTGFIMMWYWKKNQFNKNRWN
jgi:membrane associated rhomboid family serine protease